MLTQRAKQVDRRPMNQWEKLYLPAVLKGMFITLSHLFRKKVTIQYPEQKRSFPKVFRGLQILNRDEEGRERCTACGLCAVACPAEAITMEAARDNQAKNICTGRKNMQRNTRSICCVVFFADFVKKHARRMRSTYQKPLHHQIIRERDSFIKKKIC